MGVPENCNLLPLFPSTLQVLAAVSFMIIWKILRRYTSLLSSRRIRKMLSVKNRTCNG
jgi:hypothetical protein